MGCGSNNLFRVTPGGAVSVIIDATGDGDGHPLLGPIDMIVGADDNVYVSDGASDNVFRTSSSGAITRTMDATGHGLDNDADGLIDHPDDPGCEAPADGGERAAALLCDDGIDNDGDGLIDYSADPQRESVLHGSESDSEAPPVPGLPGAVAALLMGTGARAATSTWRRGIT